MMAETIELGCDGTYKWHWYNIQSDLIKCGALDEKSLAINPFAVSPHGCVGTYGGSPFRITWVYDAFMMLTTTNPAPELIQAFSNVLEYEPFVMYELNDATTIEWDKIDPEKRLLQVRKFDGVSNIKVLNEKS